MAQQITQLPPPPSRFNPELCSAAEQLILQTLEKETARRPPDMEQLIARAETLL